MLSQIFWNIGRRIAAYRQVRTDVAPQERWCDDPLSHPDIARMSLTEIADLPLGRSARCGC
ncbi:MAG: hypothetical protein H6893_11985 [Brucellaceae bacterium]|nr:hypothetical protein [Brucellaceae bacterium]MCO5059109.1 hypothetical protein [Rhizobiaceae bacterium]